MVTRAERVELIREAMRLAGMSELSRNHWPERLADHLTLAGPDDLVLPDTDETWRALGTAANGPSYYISRIRDAARRIAAEHARDVPEEPPIGSFATVSIPRDVRPSLVRTGAGWFAFGTSRGRLTDRAHTWAELNDLGTVEVIEP